MAVDKINSPNINNSINLKNTTYEEKVIKSKTDEKDEKLSSSAKYMIGASALAAVIAIGIIGHKNNWWKKLLKEGESSISNGDSSNIHTNSSNSHGNLEEISNGKNAEKVVKEETPVANIAETGAIDFSHLKTKEDVTAAFEKLAERELQTLEPNKAILEEVQKEFEELKSADPIGLIKSKNIPFEVVDKHYIIIKDEHGKMVKRLYFPQLGITAPPERIEYFNPDTEELIKIANKNIGGHDTWSIKILDKGTITKELWINPLDNADRILIVKDYKSRNFVPDSVSVFRADKNEMQGYMEYNLETGKPKFAYFEREIYIPRENSLEYFDNIIDSRPECLMHICIQNFYPRTSNRSLPYVVPRLSKKGDIMIVKGRYNIDIIDRITHKLKYSVSSSGSEKDIIITRCRPTGKKASIYYGDNGTIEGRFDGNPIEELKELKEVFSDLVHSEDNQVPQAIENMIRNISSHS